MSIKSTVFSVVSTKGGTGKTTLCANVAGLLAAMKLRVLVVDADPQASMSDYYALEKPAEFGLGDALYRGGTITQDCISTTKIPGLCVLPARLKSEDGQSVPVENWLQTRFDGLFLLRKVIRGPFIQDNFDVVIIDSPGNTGTLTGMAAMAGDFMVASFRPDMLTYTAFYNGLIPLLSSINSLRDMSPEMASGPVKILLNDAPQTNTAKGIADALRGAFRPTGSPTDHPNISVLDAYIPRRASFPEATGAQLPIHEYDRPNQRQKCGGIIIHEVVHELLPHLKGVWVDGYHPHVRARF